MSIVNVWEGWNVFIHDDIVKMVDLFVTGSTTPALDTRDSHIGKSEVSESSTLSTMEQPLFATYSDDTKSVRKKQPSVNASKWKKIDNVEEQVSAFSSPSSKLTDSNSAILESANPQDLIDTDLDGEPLTDSDLDEDKPDDGIETGDGETQ